MLRQVLEGRARRSPGAWRPAMGCSSGSSTPLTAARLQPERQRAGLGGQGPHVVERSDLALRSEGR